MSLSRNEFEVLSVFVESSTIPSDNAIDAITGLTPREVDKALDSLTARGFLENKRLTAAGIEALEPYRVKNAIIQAAGTCSRFSPLSYDIPKGLLVVHGEPMIERMIRQLHEAGIYDITMIVGHKKELYEYLGAKFGIRFVENPDYAITNTCRSLWCAREYLGRTYLLFSDTYFIENPFKRYVWEGFYSTSEVVGHTDEWLFVPGPDRYVVDMVHGGDEGEYMGGFSVLDEEIVSKLLPILDSAQGNKEAMAQYWETMWFRNLDTVKIKTRCTNTNFLEFDSMDLLYAYDPDYLNNVQSPSLDYICSILHCSREEIHDCYMLTKGLTNHTCHFAVGEREYVFRMPAGLDGRAVDYSNETTIETVAKRLGIDNTFVAEDPLTGRKLSRFVPNVRTLAQGREDSPLRPKALRMIADLHAAEGLSSAHFCDRWEETLHHEQVLRDNDIPITEEYEEMHRRVQRLKELADAEDFPVSFSHNDCWFGNYLVDQNEDMYLIDWENAGMADEASDFAFFTATVYVNHEEYDEYLEIYLGRKPTELEYRHFAAQMMIAGLWQYAWGLFITSDPNIVVDWPVHEWLVNQHDFIWWHIDWVENLYRAAGAEI